MTDVENKALYIAEEGRKVGLTLAGAAGVIANVEAESAFKSNNVQDSYERGLGMGDEEYTKRVDNGSYTRFTSDSVGYGLAQWTAGDRKSKMLSYFKQRGKSIGDFKTQVDYLYHEMRTGFSKAWGTVTSSNNPYECGYTVCRYYEICANLEASSQYRGGRAQNWYDWLVANSNNKSVIVDGSTDSGSNSSVVIQNAVKWAIDTANDNSHGYSQADRWGPDYDCSSFVITAWQHAGVPVRSKGATYTGNMKSAFISCGFTDVTSQISLGSGSGLETGDVLLNQASHTCLCIGNGKVANCRTNEGNAQAGDQSGNEIRVQNYWNCPWDCVLRYKGGSGGGTSDTTDHNWVPPTLNQSNSYSDACVVLQALLNAHHFACGSADGFYGAKTQAAVAKCQQYYGISVDGICRRQTWEKLGIKF